MEDRSRLREALPTGHLRRGPGLGAAGLSCEFSYQNPKHASGYLLFACPPSEGRAKASPWARPESVIPRGKQLEDRTVRVLNTPNITIL